MKLAIALGKVVVLAAWAWGILSYVAPASVPLPGVGQAVVLGLVAVHIAEAFIFAKSLAAEAGGSASSHAAKLFVFGYFHLLSVRYG